MGHHTLIRPYLKSSQPSVPPIWTTAKRKAVLAAPTDNPGNPPAPPNGDSGDIQPFVTWSVASPHMQSRKDSRAGGGGYESAHWRPTAPKGSQFGSNIRADRRHDPPQRDLPGDAKAVREFFNRLCRTQSELMYQVDPFGGLNTSRRPTN